MSEENNKDRDIQISLSTRELIDEQINDTFCSIMLKLINDKSVPSDKYCISDNILLHKVVRGDDKLFHALVVLLALRKYILHQVHDALGHNGTARTYQCLKLLYYCDGLHKVVMFMQNNAFSADNRNCTLSIMPIIPMHFIVMDLIGKFIPSP